MQPSQYPLLRIAGPFFLGALLLILLAAVSSEHLSANLLDFGRSLNPPTPGFGRFLALSSFFASLAAVCFALAGARAAAHHNLGHRLAKAWDSTSDRKWIFYGSLIAFLVPASIRTWLLQGLPVTDDEAAYRFMAQLLAQGRVYADSEPLKLFFDNRFLINDGKVYAHYFLGWPALMMPGLWLGLSGFMNSLYGALTVPALFRIVRRLAGSRWAKASLLLFLASPMLMLAAATELSHTSCIAALAWFTWFCLRSRDDDAGPAIHAATATAFSIAFFIRPSSALGFGLPLLIWWLVGVLRRRHGRVVPLLAFAAPAVLLAALFLYANWAQTGSATTVAYQRAYEYAQENDFRFSLWGGEGDQFKEMQWISLPFLLAVAASAIFRLNIALFGWSCSFFFAFFAGRGTLRTTLRLSLLSYFALHALTSNVGIDTLAPMHYFELAWPLLLLSACGLANLDIRSKQLDDVLPSSTLRWNALPMAGLLSLVLVAMISYVPYRFGAVARIIDDVAKPYAALEDAGIQRAVVFAPDPFVNYCSHPPTRGWVFVRPNNSPNLDDDVLWVNHLSLETNRLLMQHFPDREGFVMGWDRSCEVRFLPLAQLPPGSVPDARVSGIDKVAIDAPVRP